MTPCRRVAAVGLWAALAATACAASRMGEAAVRLEAGQPCFGLADDETRGKDLRLAAIVVSDVSVQPAQRVWVLSAAGDATLAMQGGHCVRPDQLPAGYAASTELSLQRRRPYEVFVNAPRVDGRRDAQGYTQRFCLLDSGQLQRLPHGASRCTGP